MYKLPYSAKVFKRNVKKADDDCLISIFRVTPEHQEIAHEELDRRMKKYWSKK
jgi:hypothetical protein